MASLIVRSAACRALRRSIPEGSFRRTPIRFFSDGVERTEYKRPRTTLDMALDEFQETFRKLQEETRSLKEQEKLIEKREQRQRVISYFLVPFTAAFWIYAEKTKKERERNDEANL